MFRDRLLTDSDLAGDLGLGHSSQEHSVDLVASLQDLGVFEAGSAHGLTTFRKSTYRFAVLAESSSSDVFEELFACSKVWAFGVVRVEPVHFSDELRSSGDVECSLEVGAMSGLVEKPDCLVS